MTRVLLVTVGGSPEPILEAVRLHQPDQVVFVVSAPPCEAPSLEQVTGGGAPCRHVLEDGSQDDRPNLVTQLALEGFDPERHLVLLPDPDDFSDVYQRLRRFTSQWRQTIPDLDLRGDCSGGTKSMSAALVMALAEQDAELTIVSGRRRDLVRIGSSEGLRSLGIQPLQADRRLQERLALFLEDHRYDRARQSLKDYLEYQGDALSDDRYNAGHRVLWILDALVLWDRFCWKEALDRADAIHLEVVLPELMGWWQRVWASRRWLDANVPEIPVTGYELVQDLLLNAERRGRRGWFDDAVARLYRALELLAQTYIQIELHLDHRQQHLKIGANQLLDWLQRREGSEGLGGIFNQRRGRIQSVLAARNDSLLAHGLKPIEAKVWQSLQDQLANLVEETLEELGITPGPLPVQLPGKAMLQLPDVQLLLSAPQ
ncbi:MULTISPECIES: TIGR02710 family CRISPR-associated CARF protein [unclassified Synechococcus]|uniref:TIGR02710 family CRISPR-associated CARF protein n=1 Tax=unclassified Synechococcus TaxID=2626047 RepID=UPI0021A95D41|nr:MULTISPECIES: TIGR02710 family CRISPR-associated CARF protein [unclassified Synechococcus]MCT0212424.1 TIGR02710 family CRISPR-associated protein [Synechococcus sp. CS-1326]MCT0234607.1 TIGR02710 family CRISPR-associated protein [Synechococcus sp. CS-1327]